MFSNRYQRKRVAETDSKACFICYKPTTIVLLNEDSSADFFYTCEAHLKDSGFATAEEEPNPPENVSSDELQAQIAQLKKDWDEKKSKKKAKPADSEDPQGSTQTKDQPPEIPPKPEELQTKPPTKKAPQWFKINPQIHRLRQQHVQKRSKQLKAAKLLSNPTAFPSVPTHAPK